MVIALPTEVEKLVLDKVESGAYATAEDMVRAAFVALQQQESFGDFAPGELNDLLAEGEASIAADGTLRRRHRAARPHAGAERREVTSGAPPRISGALPTCNEATRAVGRS